MKVREILQFYGELRSGRNVLDGTLESIQDAYGRDTINRQW
ncbi:MAG: hypothetical protein P8181_14560 [bacterium]